MARQINFDDIRNIQKSEERIIADVAKLTAQIEALVTLLIDTRKRQDEIGGRMDKLLSWMPGLANSR